MPAPPVRADAYTGSTRPGLASGPRDWTALFVQPANRRRQPELVGCYDIRERSLRNRLPEPDSQTLPRQGGLWKKLL